MKRFIKNIAERAGVYVAKHSAQLSADVAVRTQLIGWAGAAEAFAHYIANHEQLVADKELADFMKFYGKNWKLSASQWSQDMFVMYALNSRRDGLFLEIGGADGFTHSNTYALEKHLGWRGTLVEPDPYQFKILEQARSGNSLLHAAISPNGGSESFRLRRVGQLSALEGYEGSDMHTKARMESKDFAKVSGISLTRLLSARAYDYFSLDVEGAELKIMQSIDWDVVQKPQVLTVEHNFRDEDRSALTRLLTDQGYFEHFEGHDWLRRGDLWATLKDR